PAEEDDRAVVIRPRPRRVPAEIDAAIDYLVTAPRSFEIRRGVRRDRLLRGDPAGDIDLIPGSPAAAAEVRDEHRHPAPTPPPGGEERGQDIALKAVDHVGAGKLAE